MDREEGGIELGPDGDNVFPRDMEGKSAVAVLLWKLEFPVSVSSKKSRSTSESSSSISCFLVASANFSPNSFSPLLIVGVLPTVDLARGFGLAGVRV